MEHSFLSSSGGDERNDESLTMGVPPAQVPRSKTVNELHTEIDRLRKEVFNLKMSNFYLEEKIQKYKGGEEDMTDHYRELEEHNTSLEYEKYELEKRLEESEAKSMEVSAAFPTGCPGSQCGLPRWLCASTYIFIRFLQDIWTETYSFPVLSSSLATQTPHQLQALLRRSKEELRSMHSLQETVQGQRLENHPTPHRSDGECREMHNQVLTLQERITRVEQRCEELRGEAARAKEAEDQAVSERDMLHSRLEASEMAVERIRDEVRREEKEVVSCDEVLHF